MHRRCRFASARHYEKRASARHYEKRVAQMHCACHKSKCLAAAEQRSWADGLIITIMWSPVLLRFCRPQVALGCDRGHSWALLPAPSARHFGALLANCSQSFPAHAQGLQGQA